MIKKDIVKLEELIREKDNFLILTHVNPEGDAVGSQISVYKMLSKMGKTAVMVSNDAVPDNLRFLPETDKIKDGIPKDFYPEATIILDCPVEDRIGKILDYPKKKCFVINIDHHVSNDYFGDIYWVEPNASSVGEMIFSLAEALDIGIDKELAMCVYAAIITDTGMFNYSNTSAETHKIAGRLLANGVDPKFMHSKIFEEKAVSQVRLLGNVLSTLGIIEDGKIAYISLTRGMYEEEGVEFISTEEFINYPRAIKGVEIAVFFKENSGKKVNVSFRSTGKINVNMVASRFDGGGHKEAAGCILECGLEEAREKVLTEAVKALEDE
ncbi:MAG: bifunctional oligoribonuclease/PAP phosphatase NrnA [Candidatus Omnitrophota bacterium]